MPTFTVDTGAQQYPVLVERGALGRLGAFISPGRGVIFVLSEEGIWRMHGAAVERALAGRAWRLILFPGGEENKRLAQVEAMAEQMVEGGGDRSSLVIAFGGGVVNDLGGFLAAIFMRGVPVIQAPTTLLAQVDAGVGGKTGVNLRTGKNLVGAFHQPLAVAADPDVLATLPEREYRAGLFEVIKHGIIRSEPLFRLMQQQREDVLARQPGVVEQMVAESVRIKCEVVSLDEKESGLRRILNFGHTVGHALEAETGYSRFLHGEAVGLGMLAALRLSQLAGRLVAGLCEEMSEAVRAYGPFPSTEGLAVEGVLARLRKDKKAIQGAVHWVLATGIGATEVTAEVADDLVREAVASILK
ncbi:MAG: 3-dehydroquinate synthase [Bryobacteraceae bacterium]